MLNPVDIFTDKPATTTSRPSTGRPRDEEWDVASWYQAQTISQALHKFYVGLVAHPPPTLPQTGAFLPSRKVPVTHRVISRAQTILEK